MNNIILIKSNNKVLALVIKKEFLPDKTTFVTPDNLLQQAGFIVYPTGGNIQGHIHTPIIRTIEGTPETLIVRKGKVLAKIYDNNSLIQKIELIENDIIMLIDGGHGFEVIEDCVLFELKQGPYTGLVEKERFE